MSLGKAGGCWPPSAILGSALGARQATCLNGFAEDKRTGFGSCTGGLPSSDICLLTLQGHPAREAKEGELEAFSFSPGDPVPKSGKVKASWV